MPKVSWDQGQGGGAPLGLHPRSHPHSPSNASFSLSCFFFLTALHIYANYRAVRALVLETLNEDRLRLVLKHFLQRGEVLDPTSANQMEPLWTGDPTPWSQVLCLPSLSPCLGILTPASHRFLAISVSIPWGPPTPLNLQVSSPVSPSHRCCHLCSPHILYSVYNWPPLPGRPLSSRFLISTKQTWARLGQHGCPRATEV